MVSEWCPNASLMTDTPDTIASKRTKGNNQSLVVPLCSWCIHSDYITWLSKWLCMHIIPSFLADKGFFLPLRLSCKERLFSKTYPSFLTLKEGSTSHLGLLPSGKKRETALLGARNRYALRLADHQRSSPNCAGWDRLPIILLKVLGTTPILKQH